MVGVNERGKVDDHEHIFDIFTKLYDFSGTNVQVISAQDLWKFYEKKIGEYENSKHPVKFLNPRTWKNAKIFNPSTWRKALKKNVDIYELVLFFILHHPSAHYILDECPFLTRFGKYRIPNVQIDYCIKIFMLFL